MPATLEEVIVETPTSKTCVLKPASPIQFRPGQFLQVTMPGLGEAPFTPSSSPYDTEKIEVTVLKTGQVTDALHDAQPGQTLGVRGPFGKGYPLDKLQGTEVLVVGGGVGLAPLRSLLFALFHDIQNYKRVSIKCGARMPEELLFRSAYDEWRGLDRVDMDVSVDVASNGWTGKVGVVTTLLETTDIDLSNSYVISCGPGIMLRFVTLRCLDLGFKPSQIYLSMNRRMSCGIGKCGRCNIGPYYLCKDGPDICYDKIKDLPDAF